MNQELKLWECPKELQSIKEIYGKDLTSGEFNTLVAIGKATGLNPFLREIWAIKYSNNPASIFVGRDGFRKSAQAHPNYDYHHVEAVYSNDELNYNVNNGEVHHKQDFKNRGNLIGAYCITKRKNASRPTYVFVDLKEYDSGKSLWASKKATMIKKVAEAQCLRMTFQELFGGTYSDAEIDITEVSQATIQHHENHKQFEGQSLGQTSTMDSAALEAYLEDIGTSEDKKKLQEIYRAAKEAAKFDKIASNKISFATKERLAHFVRQAEELETTEKVQTPDNQPVKDIPKYTSQTTEEFYEQYNS